MGHHLYIHRLYAQEAIKNLSRQNRVVAQKLQWSWDYKTKDFPDFQFNAVRLDIQHGYIRFDQAPDFDQAREPHVGQWLTAYFDGYYSKGSSQSIWHHKFLWVKPDYPGFNYQEAINWSAQYLPLLTDPPKGSDKTWLKQLQEAGLAKINP